MAEVAAAIEGNTETAENRRKSTGENYGPFAATVIMMIVMAVSVSVCDNNYAS